MLPERLSTDLTSLNAGRGPPRDRRRDDASTGTATLTVSSVYRATVRNKAKLAYDSRRGVARGARRRRRPRSRRSPAWTRSSELQDAVAQKLRERRHEQGALELETIQPKAIFDGDRVVDLRQEAHNRARQLIEDFMIAANGVTARFLASKGYRLAAPRRPLARALAADRRRRQGAGRAPAAGARLEGARGVPRQAPARPIPLRFPDLSLVIVKLMGAGEYVVEKPGGAPVGHFGLAVRDYTHSTAPNRRFPDLITQRLAQGRARRAAVALLRRGARGARGALHRAGGRRGQGRAPGAQVRGGAASRETGSAQRFDAIVTGASEKGTWVRDLRAAGRGQARPRRRGAGGRPEAARQAHLDRCRARVHRFRPHGLRTATRLPAEHPQTSRRRDPYGHPGEKEESMLRTASGSSRAFFSPVRP